MFEESFSFVSNHSWKIAGRFFRSNHNTRGTIVGSHGYSEHSGRYLRFAKFLTENGFDFAMLDLPGHGMSDGRRSNIDRFDDYVDCFSDFFKTIQRMGAQAPFHGFGHSLGGLVVVRFTQTRDDAKKFESLALSSPLMGLSRQAFHGTGVLAQSSIGRGLLFLISSMMPNIKLPNKKDLGGSNLTHDQEIYKERAADPLIKPTVTFHWTREFLKARRAAIRNASLLQLPVGLFQSGEDRVVSTTQAFEFFQKLKNPKNCRIIYPGLFHEILNELPADREKVMNDILNFISSISH